MKKTVATKETCEPMTKSFVLSSAQQISMESNPSASDEKIRELAYYLWEQAGKPEGDGSNFWYEAELQIKQ